MTDIKGAILFYLETSGRYVKRPELLNHLHSLGHLIGDRKMRRILHLMSKDDGYCIQSSSKGYCMITTHEQFIAAKKYLNKKSMALLMDEFYLDRNWKRKTAPLFVDSLNN